MREAPGPRLRVGVPRFNQILDRVRRLQPTRIYSSHLPAASGTSLDEFLGVLEKVPDAEPFMPPDSQQFAEMIAAMAVEQRAEPAVADS